MKIKLKKKKSRKPADFGDNTLETGVTGEKLKMANTDTDESFESQTEMARKPKRKMRIFKKSSLPSNEKSKSGSGKIFFRGMSKNKLEERERKRLGMSKEEYEGRKKRHLRLRRK